MKTLSLVVMAIAIAAAPACKNKDKPAPAKTKAPAKAPTPPSTKAEPPPAKDKPAPAKVLVAQLAAKSGSKVGGTVTFAEKDGKVVVTARLSGLTKGVHGFHIHAKGDCSSPDGKSAGGHFNPKKVDHAGPDAPTQHAGDLGNITADDKGNASKMLTWAHVTLGPGDAAIEGLAVVVHAKADDMKSQPSGAAGKRVACGVIKAK